MSGRCRCPEFSWKTLCSHLVCDCACLLNSWCSQSISTQCRRHFNPHCQHSWRKHWLCSIASNEGVEVVDVISSTTREVLRTVSAMPTKNALSSGIWIFWVLRGKDSIFPIRVRHCGKRYARFTLGQEQESGNTSFSSFRSSDFDLRENGSISSQDYFMLCYSN